MSSLEVQCHCGEVVIQITGDPIAQYYCHCDDCQMIHGGAYLPRALYPLDSAIVLRGEPKIWKYKTIPRATCPQCSCHLFGDLPELNLRSINAYLLPTEHFRPQFHLHCRFAVLPVKDELPHYKYLPPMFGGSEEVMDW